MKRTSERTALLEIDESWDDPDPETTKEFAYEGDDFVPPEDRPTLPMLDIADDEDEDPS